MLDLVNKSLLVAKKRVATKPSKSQIEKRISQKNTMRIRKKIENFGSEKCAIDR